LVIPEAFLVCLLNLSEMEGLRPIGPLRKEVHKKEKRRDKIVKGRDESFYENKAQNHLTRDTKEG
jgi:hypothetical protein